MRRPRVPRRLRGRLPRGLPTTIPRGILGGDGRSDGAAAEGGAVRVEIGEGASAARPVPHDGHDRDLAAEARAVLGQLRGQLRTRAASVPDALSARLRSAMDAGREEYERAVQEQTADYEQRRRQPGLEPRQAWSATLPAVDRVPSGTADLPDQAPDDRRPGFRDYGTSADPMRPVAEAAAMPDAPARASAAPGVLQPGEVRAAERTEPREQGGFKGIAMQVKDGYQEDDLGGQSAEIAYRFLFALFPFFIFLAALGGTVARAAGVENPTQDVLDFLGTTLPDDANRIVSEQLEALVGNSGGGVMSIGALLALWAAAGGMNAVMKALNRVHGVDERRPLLPRYAVAIGLTLLASLAVIGAFLLIVVGQVAGDRVADGLGLSSAWETVAQVARWPVAGLLLMLATAVLYRLAPNLRIPWRAALAGAACFVVVWLVATLAFGLYVANFGSYNATYGALAGVILLMLWFYISSLALLLGAEVAEAVRRPATEGLPAA